MSHKTKYFIKTNSATRAMALPEQAANGAHWLLAAVVTVLLLITALPVKAQVYDSRDYQRQNDAYVTVYEDCDYRGRSRDLAVGDYRDVRDLGLGNDKISSMRVPRGLELELFEDERFRGAAATIDRDVSCLNRDWNDKASSLRVSYDQSRRNNGRYDSRDRNDGRYNDGRYDNRNDREDRYQNRDDRGYDDRNRRNPSDGYQGNGRGRDFTKNISRVEFANTAIVKGKRNRWSMNSYGGRNQSYREIDRDKRVIYLRNARSRELLEVNVYSSNVRVISPNGRQTDYQITRVSKDSGVAARVPPREPTVTPNPTVRPNTGGAFGVVKGSCFTYKAYARGGRGGIKFQAKNVKQQFDDDSVSGRICHSGSLSMEINKMDPNAEVFVEIQGRTYKFGKGEKEDLLLNNWYRKMVKLKVTG